MPGADGMSSKFMKNAFVGWTFTAGLYYPPDFDASKLVPLKHLKAKGAKEDKALNIRMMFPFTMVCDACGEYNYTGTKFTSKCEQIKTESYLGMKVYRFYGRCRHCWAEFTFKTDPKNSDYTMESGGKRTYEAWKDADMVEAQLKQEKEAEKTDQMKALEQKSVDVQAEMQRLEDLDAIRTLNKRLGARDQSIEKALEYLFEKEANQEKAAVEHLSAADVDEMVGFREAQDEARRRRLDEAVEDNDGEGVASHLKKGDDSLGAFGGSSASSSAPGAAGATGASAGTAGAGIAAAIAERAAEGAKGRSAVGAKFTVVKRKAADAVEPSASKRGRADDAAGDSAGAGSAAAAKDAAGPSSVAACTVGDAAGGSPAGAGGMGLGLGAYDSDSS